jgi:hypothetical protein
VVLTRSGIDGRITAHQQHDQDGTENVKNMDLARLSPRQSKHDNRHPLQYPIYIYVQESKVGGMYHPYLMINIRVV